MKENKKKREKDQSTPHSTSLNLSRASTPRPEDQTDQLWDLTPSGGGASWLEVSSEDRCSDRAPRVNLAWQDPAATLGSVWRQCLMGRLDTVPGPSGSNVARHGVVQPKRRGSACGMRASWACGLRRAHIVNYHSVMD
jgi:hypothetical protein